MLIKSTIALIACLLVNDMAVIFFPAIYNDLLHINPNFVKVNGTIIKIENLQKGFNGDKIEYSYEYIYQYDWAIDQSYNGSSKIVANSLEDITKKLNDLKNNNTLVVYYNRYNVMQSCLNIPCIDGKLSINDKYKNLRSGGWFLFIFCHLMTICLKFWLIGIMIDFFLIDRKPDHNKIIPENICQLFILIIIVGCAIYEQWVLYFEWTFNPPNIPGYLETSGIVDSLFSTDIDKLGLIYNYTVNDKNYQNDAVIIQKSNLELFNVHKYFNYLKEVNGSFPVYYNKINPETSCLYGNYEERNLIWSIYTILVWPILLGGWSFIKCCVTCPNSIRISPEPNPPNNQPSSTSNSSSNSMSNIRISHSMSTSSSHSMSTLSSHSTSPKLKSSSRSKSNSKSPSKSHSTSDIELNSNESNYDCSICLNSKINAIAQCGHGACLECLDTWNRQRGRCPICQVVIEKITTLYI